MRWIIGLVTGGGIAAFFFFSWIIQMLWNSLIWGHLGLLKPLSYLQAAGLWFLVTLLFAWVGIGAGRYVYLRRKVRDWEEIARWRPASGRPSPAGPKGRPTPTGRSWAGRSRRGSSASYATGSRKNRPIAWEWQLSGLGSKLEQQGPRCQRDSGINAARVWLPRRSPGSPATPLPRARNKNV